MRICVLFSKNLGKQESTASSDSVLVLQLPLLPIRLHISPFPPFNQEIFFFSDTLSSSLSLSFLPRLFAVSPAVQHVPALLVMKPISVTEIVSMETEVLIITDTPAARA